MIISNKALVLESTKYEPIKVKPNYVQTTFGFSLTGLAFFAGFMLNTFVLPEGNSKIVVGCIMFLIVIAGIFIAFQAEENKQTRMKAEEQRKKSYLETEEHENASRIVDWVYAQLVEIVSMKAALMLLHGKEVILLSSQRVKLIEAADDKFYLWEIRK